MARKTRKEFDADTRTLVAPRGKGQQRLVDSILYNPYTVVSGPAGSGKTLLSIQTLYQLLKSGRIDRIFIVRKISESSDEKIGALPGELDDKLSPFASPVELNLREILPQGEVKYLMENKIETKPVFHCRGCSFSNAGILVEEAQNLTDKDCITIATRLAKGSRMVFNGDPYQTDFHDGRNGMIYLERLFSNMPDSEVIKLHAQDIQRNPLIGQILQRAKELDSERSNHNRLRVI